MKIGEIYKGRKTVHPIIFLGEADETQFLGCILTHSSKSARYPNNVRLSKSHFKDSDVGRKPYNVKYDKSYFVNAKLIKKREWGDYQRVGELTKSGLKFIQLHLGNNEPQFWEIYKSNTNKRKEFVK